MADLADHAYAHACAVLGSGAVAEEAALLALRRGGRSRSAVLGHTRHLALAVAGDDSLADHDAPLPDDLGEVAAALAFTRPAIERCIIDLDTRHSLDRAGFARALGLPPAAAGTRASAVFAAWERELDPAVLALHGAGSCDELASLLPPADDAPPHAIHALVTLAPDVAAHSDTCELCRDRLRSMVSVRTLLGQRELEPAPRSVRASGASSRLRLATPPPPLEGEPSGVRRLVAGAVAVSVAVVVLVGGGAVAARRDADGSRVEALTKVPRAGSALDVSPSVIDGPVPGVVTLRNHSERAVAWKAAPDASWLEVTPTEGTLEPGEVVPLRVAIGTTAPEGDARGVVRISSADGSTTVVRLSTVVERAPDVAASSAGCEITATVEDEGEIGPVSLRWKGGGSGPEMSALMSVAAAGYTAALPNSPTPVVWWVDASDARGNKARTPDQTLAPNTCP